MPNNVANSDPAEGSREVIEHELARQEQRERDSAQKQKAESKSDADRKQPAPRKH